MRKVRIGIIGCGGIANNKHMPALRKIPEVEMVAFCDIVEERAVKAAADYGTPDAKAAADRIIGDVREDGVAALIEELWFDGPTAVPSGRDLGSPWDKIESAGGQ